MLGEVEISIPAVFHDSFRILGLLLVLEGSESPYHFANQNAYAPYVGFVSVANVHHYLGSAVARRATIRIGPICLNVLHLFSKSKIDDLDMTIVVNENVVWLEITVDDSALV